MRLFVAADLNSQQVAQLRDNVGEAKAAAPIGEIRWLPEANWHATLAFIGDREEAELPALIESIGEVVTGFRPLTVFPQRIGPMPHRSNPRLLALKGNADAPIQELYFQLGKALHLQDRVRQFRFHVTVARFREMTGDAARALNEAIKDLSVIGGAWSIDTISLYTSTLGQGGATYSRIQKWQLGR